MKLELSRRIFEKYSSTKFHENPFNGNGVVPRGRRNGQTDITEITVAFRNLTKPPNNDSYERRRDRENSSTHMRCAHYSRDVGTDRVTIYKMGIKEKGFGCASGLETSGSGNDTVLWSCEHGMNIWVP